MTETTVPEIKDDESVATPKPVTRRLTPQQWSEIAAHWEYGTMSAREITEKYGISHSALTQHLKRAEARGTPIVKNSKRHLLAVKTATAVAGGAVASVTKELTFENKRRDRIEQSKETLFRQSQSNQAVLFKIQKKIADGLANPADCFDDIKAVRQMEITLRDMIANRWRLLDVETDIDERELPQLEFRDLSDEEIVEIQNNLNSGDDEDDDIEIPVDDLEDDVIDEAGS